MNTCKQQNNVYKVTEMMLNMSDRMLLLRFHSIVQEFD